MKKNLLTLPLITIIGLSACKKDPSTGASYIELPGSGSSTPVGGTTQTTTKANIISKSLNLTLGYNKHVLLDADGDGKTDFSMVSGLLYKDGTTYLLLTANPYAGSGNSVLINQGGQQLPDAINTGVWAHPLTKDDAIAPSGTATAWLVPLQQSFVLIVEETSSSTKADGPWVNQTDKYLGIQLKYGGKTHYGWIRLTHDASNNEMKVIDFAYNTNANESIKAGEK